jgi:putative DNA primase/helicase
MALRRAPVAKQEMGSVESTKPRSYEVNEGAAASGPAGSPNLLAALDYAERSWHVFPCWWIKNGSCACGTTDCQHPGKHPLGKLVPNGKNDATTDPTTIKGWWTLYPKANIGVVTGLESGLVVLDEDPRNGGTEGLKKLQGLGNFPIGPVVFTGGRGHHIYFEHPGNGLRIKSRALPSFPGIDIKGDGGYVVAPPSNHILGETYSWKVFPEAHPPELMPDWLLALLLEDPQTRRTSSEGANHGEKIPQGARNATLASIAGTMRRRACPWRRLKQPSWPKT